VYNFFAWFNAAFDSGKRVCYVCWHVVINTKRDGIFAYIVLPRKISAVFTAVLQRIVWICVMCLVYRVKQSKTRHYVSYSCFVVALYIISSCAISLPMSQLLAKHILKAVKMKAILLFKTL
jgi:hypothetical protein